jgi:hypothetical protein
MKSEAIVLSTSSARVEVVPAAAVIIGPIEAIKRQRYNMAGK